MRDSESDRTESAVALDAQHVDIARIFNELPCYISIQDRSYRVLQANNKLVEEFGDPVSRYCYAVYKGHVEPCKDCPVIRTFEDGKEHVGEETIFDRRGLPHDVVVNTRPVRNKDGAITAVIQLFTDISLQKELESRLHNSLSRYHNLFDLVPCFISVQDRESRIIEANRLCRESFSGRAGSHCYEVYKKRSEPCTNCPVAETFKDGKIHESEEVLIDNAGRQVHVAVHTAPIADMQGNIAAVMELSDDITEIRTLQDRLASLGRLVGGTAHSMKNILEGLRGGIYVGNLGFRDNNLADIRTGWEMVERNVARISGMVMDMLYCAKERSPRRLPVSLPKVIEEVLAAVSARAGSLGIRLQTDVSDLSPILAEPRDIHALISNLVSNAIDACLAEQNEQKSYSVLVRAFRAGEEVVIEVRDNGIGMDAETLGKLFTIFFSTKGTQGTGLGLLVSHKVAAEHGGTISAQSSPGEGSTFTVKLPMEIKS